MTEQEREAAAPHFARNPGDGDPIGGGLRKARIPGRSQGKRGGYRVLTFYRLSDELVLLLDVISKGERENWTDDEVKELRRDR